MTVYVVVISEADAKVMLFSTADKAIAFATNFAKENDQGVPPEDATISPEDLEASGYLFYACYALDGDYVFVEQREIDE